MRTLGSVIAATVITATASAHHSPAAFDLNSQITIQGTVSRLDWTNPHVYIYVNGESGSGKPGRWDGDVLVVDTTLFADHLLGNYVGNGGEPRVLPSGPGKHLVERYQLSEDRTRLLISSVVEDPDYLAEPLTMSTEWDHAPQLRLLRFACDREQARRYLFR